MQKTSEKIKVAVRCRPLMEKEKDKGHQKCVFVDLDRGEIAVKKLEDPSEAPRNFFFDKVFDERLSQEKIFNDTSLPIIESVVQGYNGTIFAYGQTGTGKTHTMEGNMKSETEKGIIPRTFEMIFNLIKATYNTNYLIRVSFLELYNEEIRDLLAKNQKQKLDIREDPETGFYVKDLSNYVVKSPKDMLDLMERGRELRHTGTTQMNDHSSRSHSVFTIIVDNSTQDASGEDHIRMGKLNLVDLAGSERQSKTGAAGKVLTEGININLSLTALGNVIKALATDKKQHVPYRDSKLTKLLMDSLGGNSKTVMIANIGPADYNFEETLTTLRYANRAKDIKNAPKINEDPKDAMIRQYQEELNKLKQMLAEQGPGGMTMPGEINPMTGQPVISTNSKKRIEDMEAKILREKEQILKEVECEKKKIEESKSHAEDEKLKLLNQLKAKQDEQDKTHQNKEKLIQKLKMLEEKFVIGEENEKKAKENEKVLKQAKDEIELQERKRLQLQNEIKKNEEEEISIIQGTKMQKNELKEKEKIFEKLKQKLKEAENERDDINKEFEQGYNEFYEYKRQLEKEINYKDVVINHCIPQKYLEWVENLMQFDEETGEWYIEKLEDYVNVTGKENEDNRHMLAMGFNDDEELFSQNMMNNDIQLSMILEMNNQPKSVYYSYGDDKKAKKNGTGVKNRIATAKGKN